MKIKNGYVLRKIDGMNQICAVPPAAPLNSTISLNESASFLWEQLSGGVGSKEQLLNALLARFNISTVLALNDIDVFLKTLKEHDILENDNR